MTDEPTAPHPTEPDGPTGRIVEVPGRGAVNLREGVPAEGELAARPSRGWPNRRLARIAKLAGAPLAPAAGVDLHVRCGDFVERGQALFTLHAESPGELAYALDYALQQAEAVQVAEDS